MALFSEPARPALGRAVDPTPARQVARAAPELRLAIARALGAVVVTLHGELRRSTTRALSAALRDLIDGQGNLYVIVDMHDVRVGDAGGLQVLASARGAVESRGGRFLLAGASDETASAIRAAGLGDVIELHPERRGHPSASRTRRP